MKGSRWYLTVAIGLVALTVGAGFQNAETKRKDRPNVTVRGGALGSSVEVLGLLDAPLGTLLTLRGNMLAERPNRKGVDVERTFEVRQVDDRVLDRPIAIELTYRWNGETKVAPGEKLELIGYETGGFSGIAPAEMDWQGDARNLHDGPGMRQDYGWHFSIDFDVLQFDKLPARE